MQWLVSCILREQGAEALAHGKQGLVSGLYVLVDALKYYIQSKNFDVC